MEQTKPIDQLYENLVEKLRTQYDWDGVKTVLFWDQRVNLPPDGKKARARQMSRVKRLLHEKRIDPELGDLLNILEDRQGEMDPQQQIVFREARRAYDRAISLPTDFVQEKSRHTSEAYQVWVEAKEENNFKLFEPYLEKNVKLARKEADYLGYEESPYDPLLDNFDAGLTENRVEELVSTMKEPLQEMVETIQNASRQPDTKRLITSKDWPVGAQATLGESFVRAIGFDMDGGHIDTTVHPFCVGYQGDVRITTSYNKNNPLRAWTGLLHEAGHGLYKQGLPPGTWGTPLSDSVGMAVHESQARLWENLVGRSEAFWEWAWPRVEKHFPNQTLDVDLESFTFAVREVKPDFIRTEADEVTYNLHIILRFELERDLIKGNLEVADLPEAWNQKMKSLLGITPPDHARGVLQDVHWSGASFGYFPSYALGNLIAAQLYAKAEEDLGSLPDMFRNGEFQPLMAWTREQVHRKGKQYDTDGLLEDITGEPVRTQPFLDHLKNNYLPLYT